MNINSQMFWSDAPYLGVLWVWGKGIYECAGIIFLLNIGKLYLNRKNRVLSYLNRSSFTIYIFHFLPVNFFTWIFLRQQMPIFVKYLLVVALSYLAVFCINELWRRAKLFLSARSV